ncbi:MAG: SIS domain-containing protein [Bryobacteraceae bacterium]
MTTPLFENILAQPTALQVVGVYQFGPGLPAILRSAELLRNSKRIVLTGMGASLFACIPMRYALSAKGISVSVAETAELLHFLNAELGRDTAVILVSRSGESVETVKLLDLLDHRHYPTVGVLNVPGSTLAARTTEHILLNSPADQLVAVQTYIATAVTLLLLTAAYLDEFDQAKSDLAATVAHLTGWIEECIAASHASQAFTDLTTPLYILSRGPGLASVDEGVLLMHEVAKTPATGMSIAQFRHGFVEAADDRIRAVVIGTQSVTAAIDHQFAVDMTKMGAAVRWIGPLESDSSLQTLGTWPETVPARFASVFEAVPLQLLAYRTAESRGLTPGLFRWASTVTGSESGFPGLS